MSYTQFVFSRKCRSGTAVLPREMRKLQGITRRSTDKGRWRLCLGEEDVKRVLLVGLETRI